MGKGESLPLDFPLEESRYDFFLLELKIKRKNKTSKAKKRKKTEKDGVW